MGLKTILAKHLRKPHGLIGKIVALLMNKTNDNMNKFTIEQLDLHPHEYILEIGFGNGKYFTNLIKEVSKGKLFGLDYSETMVNQVKFRHQKLIKQGLLEVTQGSISSMPYEDGKFDKIFTVNTIYFWPDPINDIKEMYRILKDKGRLVITFRAKENMEKLSFTKHGFTLYSTDEVMNILKNAGFKDISLVSKLDNRGEIYSVITNK
jgi:ubiquinone/menaquinone biosynthesis C-methylase UbiE